MINVYQGLFSTRGKTLGKRLGQSIKCLIKKHSVNTKDRLLKIINIINLNKRSEFLIRGVKLI
jgi:hypothetical protein